MIELLALDVDGTLIDERMTIPERVRQTVLRVQQEGVTVTLATGRMVESTAPYARELDIQAPLICYQGGLVQALDADEPLYRATMDRELVREALVWSEEQGWHAALYADDTIFLAERCRAESFYRDLLGPNLRWVDDLVAVLERRDPAKFLLIAERSEADEIEAVLRERFEGRMEIVRSHEWFVEGNPLGVSKGDALRRLADHLGVDRARVMAIGDQGNDVSMLVWAGVGVAMRSGSAAAKDAADWIAPPFGEDGAAVAMERFILSF